MVTVKAKNGLRWPFS